MENKLFRVLLPIFAIVGILLLIFIGLEVFKEDRESVRSVASTPTPDPITDPQMKEIFGSSPMAYLIGLELIETYSETCWVTFQSASGTMSTYYFDYVTPPADLTKENVSPPLLEELVMSEADRYRVIEYIYTRLDEFPVEVHPNGRYRDAAGNEWYAVGHMFFQAKYEAGFKGCELDSE